MPHSAPSLDESQRAAYSRYLAAIQAPSLSCSDAPFEGYRHLLLPTYGGAVVILVSSVDGHGWQVATFRFEHPTSAGQVIVSKQSTRSLSQSDATTIREALDQAKVWSVKAWPTKVPDEGPVCVFEARKANVYRVVSRICGQDDAFDHVAQLFQKVAHSSGERH